MYPSEALLLVLTELNKATNIHDPFNSPQEGFYVILEEVVELFIEVWKCKSFNDRPVGLQKEAVQVAAMALRFIIDCTEVSESVR